MPRRFPDIPSDSPDPCGAAQYATGGPPRIDLKLQAAVAYCTNRRTASLSCTPSTGALANFEAVNEPATLNGPLLQKNEDGPIVPRTTRPPGALASSILPIGPGMDVVGGGVAGGVPGLPVAPPNMVALTVISPLQLTPGELAIAAG